MLKVVLRNLDTGTYITASSRACTNFINRLSYNALYTYDKKDHIGNARLETEVEGLLAMFEMSS